MGGMDITTKPSLLFFLGFGICIAYIPGIVGASIATGWFFLILVMVLIAPITLPPLFLIYAIISLLWTLNLNIALLFLLQFVALWLTFEFGRSLKDLRPIFKGIALGLLVSDIVALFFQKYVYSLIEAKAGLFLNPNIFSEVSAVVLVALITLKLYWWIPITLPALVLVHSRTSILALGLGLFIRANFWWRIIIFVSCFLIIHFSYFQISSIYERFNLWQDTIRGFKLFGNGVGSFEILYPLNSIYVDTSLARARYAHNDLLQLVFEFGLGVLLLLPVFWKVIKSGNAILYSLALVSCLAFPFHVPLLAFIGCLVAGHISNNNDTVWNFRDSWGPILFKRFKGKKFNSLVNS